MVQPLTQPHNPVATAGARQNLASDPTHSVWVSASAGTGKTKVLTDRILRLLLPRVDGKPGTKPHKILGLTFTKAAANEMALRLHKTLGQWAVMPDEDLAGKLESLLGHPPDEDTQKAARRLFAEVVDTPGGLQIMTIHAFCQSVLSRFPLEAGLPPYFNVLEEGDAARLLEDSQKAVLTRAENGEDIRLSEALNIVAEKTNEAQFFELLRDLASERHQFEQLLARHFGLEGLYTKLCQTLDIPPGADGVTYLNQALQDSVFNVQGLREACDILIHAKTKTDQKTGTIMADFLAAPSEQRARDFDRYKGLFLTKDLEIRKRLMGGPLSKQHPHILDILETEAQRIFRLEEHLRAVRCATLTRALLYLGHEILEEYQARKSARAALDFDDLIFKTLDLLEGRNVPLQGDTANAWILFKLDQGLDHILIDEAQDTNPEQWQVIEALCSDFFSGQATRDEDETGPRTVFTVGDEKQSIYSFQRASPEKFGRMQNHFAQKVREAQKDWMSVDLDISFRSTKAVLEVVDHCFADHFPQTKHTAARAGQAGHVELWPLFETEKADPRDPWAPPVELCDNPGAAARLARHIAQNIRDWLDKGKMLQSHGRPVLPGDILILVRTRNSFVDQLTRALKSLNIPVGGIDRMVLGTQLAVQDMMALAQMALLPSDDLTLATVLKTPFIGLSEDQLFALAYDRPGSLWAALKDSAHQDIYSWLSRLVSYARKDGPYSFFSRILQQACPADPISGLRAVQARLGMNALDPLDELLNAALRDEQNHTPSLQSFLHRQTHTDSSIKREQEQSGGYVRIMTVHGAKGLQAPIVILPDTMRQSAGGAGKSGDRLLWPDKSGLDVPLWAPRKEDACYDFVRAEEVLRARQDEEYRRLLYVAMTRAEDELYIAGYKGLRASAAEQWYNLMRTGLERSPDLQEDKEGRLWASNPQSAAPDREPQDERSTQKNTPLPDWLFEHAPDEPSPPRPLIPSRPSAQEPSAPSPLQTGGPNMFRRGLLIHKMLEILPALPSDQRGPAGAHFLKHHAAQFTTGERAQMLSQTLEVLAHPDFAALFGPGSQAEVPVSGLLPDGRLISGQIDRLLITDDEILIVDYKTGRAPPSEPKDIPRAYINQMAAYEAALRAIYPDRPVRTALLWTEGPTLMPLARAQ